MTHRRSGNPSHHFAAAVAACALGWWLIDLGLLRGGTPHPLDDTWEYGLVARSLLAGHGFRTPLIHPPLWGLRDAAFTVPMCVHGPLLPLVIAPLLALFGRVAVDGMACLAAVFAVLAAVFTARAVARAAGAHAGAVAAALVTLSPTLLRMVHHDVAPAAGACATALALDLVACPRPRAFVAGIVLGAGALVRPELLLAAPFAAYALGAAGVAPFALGAAVALAPWAAHALLAPAHGFGLSAYLLIAYTRPHPGLSPLWDFAIPPERWPAALGATLPALPAKWLHLAPRALKHMLMVPGPGLGAAAAAGLLVAATDPRSRRRAAAALGVAAIPFVVCTATESSERYVAVFLPLWAAGAVHAAWAFARDGNGERRARLALLAVLLPFTLWALAVEARGAASLRRWLVAERSALASRAAPELRARLMFSDTPDFAAWTTGRPVVATTLDGYHALAAAGNPALPAPGGPRDEWFHTDVHALPAVGAAADTIAMDLARSAARGIAPGAEHR